MGNFILFYSLRSDWPCCDKGHPPLEMVNPSWAFDPIDCDEERPSPVPARGCVMHKVACGDVIEGTTTGGKSHFGDKFYQKKAFCTLPPRL